MTDASYFDRDAWYAALPTAYLAAGALITDPSGRVLLVKPNYRPGWSLPGGICEHGEPPHEACEREVLEELGLAIPAGPLLVLAWAPPDGERPKPILHFLFDGGTLPDGGGIRLQREELDQYRFVQAGAAASYLPSNVAPRVHAALQARTTSGPIYLPSGTAYPPSR
jgi:8-oxo-dGTP diphosphatase